MEKCAQSTLLVAVLLCAVRTWKPGSPFYELHVAAMRGHSHRCRGAGSTREADSALAGTHANLIVMLCRHWDRISSSRVRTNKQTNKTKQNKTKQNKTKQNKTKQNKTKQNKTKQNKTKQNKTNKQTNKQHSPDGWPSCRGRESSVARQAPTLVGGPGW